MEILRASEIEQALEQEYRQYLTGHLQKPQPYLPHIDDDIEVGMSLYKEFTADMPHVHPLCTEHGYVLKGKLKLLLLDGSGQEFEYHQGDFFVLRPNVPYASKNDADTKILFIKHPAVNDKKLVEIDEATRKWLSAWEPEESPDQPELIPPEALSANINAQYERLREVCRRWKRGLLSEDEVRRELDDAIYRGHTEFIRDHRLRERLNWSEPGPWERFCEDLRLWKDGKAPCSKAGDVWLTYKPDPDADKPAAAQEASCADKSSFFELMEAFHIPAEYYRPAPDGTVFPDRYPGRRHSDLVVGFYIWTDDGGLLSPEFRLGDTIVLTDHHGLKSVIKVTERLTPQDEEHEQGLAMDFTGTGIIEGYTTARERQIFIYVYKGKIASLHTKRDLDDEKVLEDFPLWNDVNAFYEAKNRMREEIREDLLRSFMDEQ